MICEICGSMDLVAYHHIKSRGSGGTEHDDNLIALCTYGCHEKIHHYGLTKFCKEFPKMERILIKKGWEKDPYNKWRRYGI